MAGGRFLCAGCLRTVGLLFPRRWRTSERHFSKPMSMQRQHFPSERKTKGNFFFQFELLFCYTVHANETLHCLSLLQPAPEHHQTTAGAVPPPPTPPEDKPAEKRIISRAMLVLGKHLCLIDDSCGSGNLSVPLSLALLISVFHCINWKSLAALGGGNHFVHRNQSNLVTGQ